MSTSLRRDLSLTSLTLAVVTGTIGSGWLLAPYFTARLAGSASLLAWIVGGVMAFLLALVFAELGSLIPSSGALAQIPLLSHGRLSGFIGGWGVWLTYMALPAIELLALFDYISSNLPWLTVEQNGDELLSPAGHGLAVLLIILLCWINLNGVKSLAQWIDGLTIWKLLIPLLLSVVLMAFSGHWGNLTVDVGGPEGSDIVQAVGSGGILFSLLGFRTAMDLAGEARNPSRDVPLAMAIGLGICLLLYLILQLAFLVSVPPDALAHGWHHLKLTAHGGPMVALAITSGLGWIVALLLLDAVITPAATALTYVGVAGRISWMMGKCSLLPKSLGTLNQQGIPHIAVILSAIVSALMLAVGPGWQTVMSFLTSTLIIALATGPVSLIALRRQLPDNHRGFRLLQAEWLCPLSFVLSTWAITWCGTAALEGATLCIAVPSLIFALHRLLHQKAVEIYSALWWPLYLGLLILDMEFFDKEAPFALTEVSQLLVQSVIALVLFPIAVNSALSKPSPHALFPVKLTTENV